MENQRLRVYNRAREGFLSLEVVVVDTTTEPLKRLLEDLDVKGGTGIWLMPYRGIPSAPGMTPFDLIYLDQDHRIVQEVESYPSPESKPLNPQTASALVLPPHTIFASQAVTGDQLEFRDAAEMRSQGEDGSSSSLSADRSRQLRLAIQKLDEEEAESPDQEKGSLMTRFLRWLNANPSDRRRGNRHPLPGLVAYHWTGGAPKAYHLGDISHSGLYLLTEDRPFPGTILLMTLQITHSDGDIPGNSIAVRTKVVRWGVDGVGFEFVLSMSADPQGGGVRTENEADRKTLDEFLKQLQLPKER